VPAVAQPSHVSALAAGQTYHIEGWTVLAGDDGIRFTNDGTKHGMFIGSDTGVLEPGREKQIKERDEMKTLFTYACIALLFLAIFFPLGATVRLLIIGFLVLLLVVLFVRARVKEPRIVQVSSQEQAGQGGTGQTPDPPVKERCQGSGLEGFSAPHSSVGVCPVCHQNQPMMPDGRMIMHDRLRT
jgi:hypothetical protein